VADYRDPAAWAAAVRALRREPEELARLGEAARAHLRAEEFAGEAIVRRFLAVCRQAEARATPQSIALEGG
jgi:glycosyltransferase involved in cell wall biosynthesis